MKCKKCHVCRPKGVSEKLDHQKKCQEYKKQEKWTSKETIQKQQDVKRKKGEKGCRENLDRQRIWERRATLLSQSV